MDEITYSMDTLSALGVKFPTNANGVYPGDPKLDPVMEELNRRKALVIIHPNRARQAPKDVITGKVAALFEYPADTTRALLNMIAHNIMVRFPDIRFVIPHTGSFLPFMYQRMKGVSKILARNGLMDETNVDDNIRSLYFDIAGDPEPNQLDMLLSITNDDHIVYGSDFPHSPAKIIEMKKRDLEHSKKWESILPKIYGENGARLLTDIGAAVPLS